MKRLSIAAVFAVLSTAVVATPALAAPKVSPPPTLGATPCKLTDVSPTASACAGWYVKNLINGSSDAEQAFGLNALFGGSSFSAATITWKETLESISGDKIDFATALFGDTVIGVHVGGAGGTGIGVGYSGTAFFRFDAGNLVGGLNKIGFNRGGLSNARLYSTGTFVSPPVPEPATWGMMLLGFGIVGSALRRRRTLAIA